MLYVSLATTTTTSRLTHVVVLCLGGVFVCVCVGNEYVDNFLLLFFSSCSTTTKTTTTRFAIFILCSSSTLFDGVVVVVVVVVIVVSYIEYVYFGKNSQDIAWDIGKDYHIHTHTARDTFI